MKGKNKTGIEEQFCVSMDRHLGNVPEFNLIQAFEKIPLEYLCEGHSVRDCWYPTLQVSMCVNTSKGSQRRAVLPDSRSCRAAVDLQTVQLARRGAAGCRALASLVWADAVPAAGALRSPACATSALLHPPESSRRSTQHGV